MRRFASLYHPSYPMKLAFMLQMVAYSPTEFWQWWRQVEDFRQVDKRRKLEMTRAAKVLVLVILSVLFFVLGLSVGLTILSLQLANPWLQLIGIAAFVLYPLLLTGTMLGIVVLANTLVVRRLHQKRISQSRTIFKQHAGTRIAIAGSFGKTTLKEILATILSEGGKTAATPGNKNVAISHAAFAESLDRDEQYVIVEFGEGYPGDVATFCQNVSPHIGIITGIAPNHLDQYKTLDNLRADLLSLAEFVGKEHAYASDAPEFAQAVKADHIFTETGVMGWHVMDVRNNLDGLHFTLKKGKEKIDVRSKLVGRHLIPVLALSAALARQLGLSIAQIEAGLSKTKPYEHRLQPRNLQGAWIIDDTYNGNIEGMRVGLALLAELKTNGKKRYVTPGLVDQGEETQRVHEMLGKLIAEAQPDEVVLMKNSVTSTIKDSLQKHDFKGNVMTIDDPLTYYKNMDVTLAAGDVVLLQNDWTDNYV